MARGPDGSHWPANTPAYSSTPNKHATTATIGTVFASATSGDVIGLAAGTYVDLHIDGGSTGWATNVLIKPDTGVARSSISFTGITQLTASHVTVAGIGSIVELRFGDSSWNLPNRTFLARSIMFGTVTTDYSRLDSWGSANCGLYEVVRRQTCTNHGSADDLMQIKAAGGNFFSNAGNGNAPPTTNFAVVGCHLAGNVTLRTDGAEHCDTIQLGAASGTSMTDTILTMSSNSSIQCEGPADSGSIDIVNCYMEGSDTAELLALTGNSSSFADVGNVAINSGNLRITGSYIVGQLNSGSDDVADYVRSSSIRSYHFAPADLTGTTVNPSLPYARPAPPSDSDLATAWDGAAPPPATSVVPQAGFFALPV